MQYVFCFRKFVNFTFNRNEKISWNEIMRWWFLRFCNLFFCMVASTPPVLSHLVQESFLQISFTGIHSHALLHKLIYNFGDENIPSLVPGFPVIRWRPPHLFMPNVGANFAVSPPMLGPTMPFHARHSSTSNVRLLFAVKYLERDVDRHEIVAKRCLWRVRLRKWADVMCCFTSSSAESFRWTVPRPISWPHSWVHDPPMFNNGEITAHLIDCITSYVAQFLICVTQWDYVIACDVVIAWSMHASNSRILHRVLLVFINCVWNVVCIWTTSSHCTSPNSMRHIL